MSRKLSDLVPHFADRAAAVQSQGLECGLDLLIYCTHRTIDEQARLYRGGRSILEIQDKADELDKRYGRPDLAELLLDVGPNHSSVVSTWAGPGQSAHNYRLAFDAVPMRGGKPVWGTHDPADKSLWMRYGALIFEHGMDWAGEWTQKKREFPHAQASLFDWRAMIGSWRFQ